jgi:hypothetical protein
MATILEIKEDYLKVQNDKDGNIIYIRPIPLE